MWVKLGWITDEPDAIYTREKVEKTEKRDKIDKICGFLSLPAFRGEKCI